MHEISLDAHEQSTGQVRSVHFKWLNLAITETEQMITYDDLRNSQFHKQLHKKYSLNTANHTAEWYLENEVGQDFLDCIFHKELVIAGLRDDLEDNQSRLDNGVQQQDDCLLLFNNLETTKNNIARCNRDIQTLKGQ